MPLHRIIDLAPFVADPNWAELQTTAPTLPTWAPIQMIGTKRVIWVAVGWSSLDVGGTPQPNTSLVFTGEMQVRMRDERGGNVFAAYQTITNFPAGRLVQDMALPEFGEGFIRISAVTNPGAVPALAIFWNYAAPAESR